MYTPDGHKGRELGSKVHREARIEREQIWILTQLVSRGPGEMAVGVGKYVGSDKESCQPAATLAATAYRWMWTHHQTASSFGGATVTQCVLRFTDFCVR